MNRVFSYGYLVFFLKGVIEYLFKKKKEKKKSFPTA